MVILILQHMAGTLLMMKTNATSCSHQAGGTLLRLHTTPVGCQVMTGTGHAWMSAGAMDVSMLHVRMLTTGLH